MKEITRRVAAIMALVLVATALWAVPARAQVDNQIIYNALSLLWCLERRGANAPVVMNPCADRTEQIWNLDPIYETPENDYRIVAWGSSLCLDQHYSTATTPTNLLRAWDCTGVRNQAWTISQGRVANIIKNARSGWCLDQSHLRPDGGPTNTVVAWPNCHLALNQQWYNQGY